MTMEIRPYESRDLESVADLLHDMSVHYNASNASSRAVVRSNLLEQILGPHSGVKLVLALDASRVVGLATVSILYPAPKERGQLFMKDLYVHSAARGAGIGERLMRWLAIYATQHGCARFDWTAETSNPRALRFYEELGAKRVEEKVYFRFAGEDLLAFSERGPALP